MNTTTRYDKNETAKMVRRMLKESFPGQKFSVRATWATHSPAIDIYWTDGPTTKQVEAKVNVFRCGDFDGMQDLMTYRTSINPWTNEPADYACDFLSCHREYSAEAYTKLRDMVCQDWQLNPDEFPVLFTSSNSPYVKRTYNHEINKRAGDDVSTLIWRKGQEISFYETKEQTISEPTPEPQEDTNSGVWVSEYKGNSIINLPNGSRSFSFGVSKARLILEHLDEIKSFVEDNS